MSNGPAAVAAISVPTLEDYGLREDMARVELITPDVAKAMLSDNPRNRRVSPTKVDEYAAAQQRREWRFNGESIKVSVGGHLLDGQHRLLAVVVTGLPIVCVVVRGLPDDYEVQETIDRGAARTVSGQLTIRGERNASSLAAALRLLYHYCRDATLRSQPPSPTSQELFNLLDRHSLIRESVAYARSASEGAGVIPVPPAALIHYLGGRFAYNVDDALDNADAFLEMLSSGAGLEEGSPILAARNVLLRSRGPSKTPSWLRAAWTIKAWNAWIEGRAVTRISYSPGGIRPESFPLVVGALPKDVDGELAVMRDAPHRPRGQGLTSVLRELYGKA